MEKRDPSNLAVFSGKMIRRKFINNRWFFSIIDVVAVLTESERPRKYWADLKSDLINEGSELSAFIGQLKMLAEDGKMRETDVADTEGIFRIIQSIPSKKAEPFKRWLAKVGYERVQEIENPELAQERMKQLL
jgi:DNA-damage-inducible protein D